MIGPGFAAAAIGGPFLRKLALWACVALVLIGLGAGTVWYFVADNLAKKDARIEQLAEAAKEAQAARERDAATLARREQAIAAAGREAVLLRQSLAAALAAHREWASQPVPDAVRQALETPP
jgi:hypothetical protein